MNTIHIKDLEFWGTHGQTGDEHIIAQPFSVAVTASYDFKKALRTDALEDAIDYKKIEAIAKRVIEGESRVLIETLASTVADIVMQETSALSVEVVISKPRAKSIGLPSVTFTKKREVILSGITKESVEQLYSEAHDGILHLKDVIYRTLDRNKVRDWYAKKEKGFERKDEKYLENNQEVSVVFNGPFNSISELDSIQENALHELYLQVRNQIATYSNVPLKEGDKLETKLIKYPISELGVEAHRDLSSNINCIILMCLYGTTTFYTSSDKKRSDEKGYLVEPGDILIMRGPRTKEENDLRPIHYVLDVKEERLVFVCREIEDATEAIVNKNNWRGF